MAYSTYTFLDAKRAVYALLGGQTVAEAQLGVSNIADAVNRAQVDALSQLGSLAFAGSLATSTTVAQAGTAEEAFSFSAADMLVPVVAEVLSAAATYANASWCLPEKYYTLSRTAKVAGYYQYTFIGTDVLVRPLVPATVGSVILHHIKKPTILAADADALGADPRLFRAICTRSGWLLLQRLPATDPQRIGQLDKDYTAEMAGWKAWLQAKMAEEFQQRSGRDLAFGGKAPGQGG